MKINPLAKTRLDKRISQVSNSRNNDYSIELDFSSTPVFQSFKLNASSVGRNPLYKNITPSQVGSSPTDTEFSTFEKKSTSS